LAAAALEACFRKSTRYNDAIVGEVVRTSAAYAGYYSAYYAYAHLTSRHRIREELRPGDLGYIVYLHSQVYARECGYSLHAESYVLAGLEELTEQHIAFNLVLVALQPAPGRLMHAPSTLLLDPGGTS
jgi:hypothetical protein